MRALINTCAQQRVRSITRALNNVCAHNSVFLSKTDLIFYAKNVEKLQTHVNDFWRESSNMFFLQEENNYPDGSRLPYVYQQEMLRLSQLFHRIWKDLMMKASSPDSTLTIQRPNCIRIPLYLGNGFSAHQICVPVRTVLKKW